MNIHKLSIIIPTFNESKTILSILDKIKNVVLQGNIEKEVIVVDEDCSIDETEAIILNYQKLNIELNIIYIKNQGNKGKGASVRKGINIATGEYLIIQDADMEYDPNDYYDLLKPVLSGVADVVYGSRFIGNKPHKTPFFWHTIFNKFLTFISNALTNFNLSDIATCYKLFDTKLIQSINLKENRFGFDPEVTAKIGKIKGIRICEVGISYYGRTYKEGKKINWKDGFRAIYCIVRYSILR